jgi:hypothetical protein
MKCVLILAVAGALAGAVGAEDFINEHFEGSFPPPGWTAENSEHVSWDRESGSGPWGFYALGDADFSEGQSGTALLTTPEFRLPRDRDVYVRFDWRAILYAYATGYAQFTLECVEPSRVLIEQRFGEETFWTPFYTHVRNAVGERFRAKWLVSGSCSWRYGFYRFYLDRVYVADREVFPDVGAASWGRVKALYR